MSEFRPEDDLSHVAPRNIKDDPRLIKALEENDDDAVEAILKEFESATAPGFRKTMAHQPPSPFRRLLKALHLA